MVDETADMSGAGNYIISWYGSTDATPQGLSLIHWRWNQAGGGYFGNQDDTFSESYTVPASGVFVGSGGAGDDQYTLGANGQAAFILGTPGWYELCLELQAPTWSGSGVLLQRSEEHTSELQSL